MGGSVPGLSRLGLAFLTCFVGWGPASLGAAVIKLM